jgi:NTE family protein
MKVGLVLSGGGAKGAYQVGVVESLAEHGIEVEMVAGASIGALNSAIVSASSDISIAAGRLKEVWELVAEENVLQVDSSNYPRYLGMLVAAGLMGPGRAGLALLASLSGSQPDSGFIDSSPLTRILDRYLSPQELSGGRPLYVALYPYKGRLHALSEIVKGELIQRFDTQNSVFKHIQSLNSEDQREALLASAAIPVLFTPRKVQGRYYSDGGQGGYRKVQGNTPITPLLGQGLDAIIVSHLSDGSHWDATDFPGENIFELRPATSISQNGALDMLGFDEKKILDWQLQGKSDTDELLKKLHRLAGSRDRLAHSEAKLRQNIKTSGETLESASLEVAMRKLRKS